MSEKTPELSIVIPVYNESIKLYKDIKEIADFIKRQNLEAEVLIVDDGSRDDTVTIAQKAISQYGLKGRILPNGKNYGKGYSVRQGIMNAQSLYVMFVDSGHCIDYKYAMAGLRLLRENKCDIVHASRRLPGSVIKLHQPFIRRFTSKLFRFYSIVVMGIPPQLTDTQCGFKLYKTDVAKTLYGQSTINGFSFDVEIILRALKKRFRIQEIPVEWVCDHDSRLHVVAIARKVLSEFSEMKKSI